MEQTADRKNSRDLQQQENQSHSTECNSSAPAPLRRTQPEWRPIALSAADPFCDILRRMKSSTKGRRTPHGSRPKDAAAQEDAAAQGGKPRSSLLWLPALFTLIFAGFTLLPRVNENPHLTASFLVSAGVLLVGLCAVWWSVVRTRRTLTYEFVPRRVHWVQMIMHSSVYAYWGWYWREVYHEIPLIFAQVVFLYVLDMLVCWSRRDKWILGFGQIPIIFSMNLFLWFRDDWFYLQFVMVALIVFGKEFLRWKRDGQSTHIFNPSAFALFLTSIVLIATGTTPITWGTEISTTFNYPPHIYMEICTNSSISTSIRPFSWVCISW
jgi:hypothetical protein